MLAHFEVLSPLGAGGMGEVYRARDTKLGREVALKVLPDAVTLDADRFARFEREAQILASLNEPGILTVHSIEDIGLCCFIVTELVDGRELTRVVPPEGMPLEAFLDVSVQLVRAIAAAHRGGILHRDLKPANVMVTRSGLVKVLDFGLAKMVDGGDEVAAAAAIELTRSGTVMGTVPYMSPEQLHGREVDARSDVFSLGIVLYEMLCGVRPFGGESAAALSSAILRDEPAPVSSRRGQLPRQIERIVRHCLEKDPDRRYANAGALLYDLENLKDELRSSTGAAAPTRIAAPLPAIGREAMESGIEQEIRFCTAADGVSLAYATVGQGSPLVRALGWFTHLELEWKWPEGRQFWERLARRHLLVRYDGRGMGLSKAAVESFSLEDRVRDLEAVVDAAGLERFALMGMSEGGQTAIAYTARHPERVSHLVLYGTYSDASNFKAEREKWKALMQLVKTGWGNETPVFRQIFTHLFLGADADAAQIAYFNEIQRASASAETAFAFMRFNGRVDVIEAARQIQCPTLVLHRRGDLLVPFESGRKVASLIRGARFIPMDGDNHWLLLRDPGAEEYADAIERFLAEPAPGQ
jgi:pimeloyl-ACP methyl ester carboxylesterase